MARLVRHRPYQYLAEAGARKRTKTIDNFLATVGDMVQQI
jgi:hypothetical protein